MPDERDNLDLLIDSALSTYAEPRAGLETRVLKHLVSRPARQRWLPFAIALPLAACLVLLMLLFPRHDRVEPMRQAQRAPVPPTQSVPQNSIAHASKTPSRQRQSRVIAGLVPHPATPKPAPLPKLDVFPSPQPLSPEERALLHYVARAPEPERKALIATQNQPVAPLAIAEIQIPPLEPLDKTDKNGN
jgi:hypothetical protein